MSYFFIGQRVRAVRDLRIAGMPHGALGVEGIVVDLYRYAEGGVWGVDLGAVGARMFAPEELERTTNPPPSRARA